MAGTKNKNILSTYRSHLHHSTYVQNVACAALGEGWSESGPNGESKESILRGFLH
ncbi:hypothetical protein V1264_001437 [Littorina saxatilis]|uniref:Uncharacterized protein n=1 Tax=Littorina saxatilis TaxID=31220 RepID=A0AAN9C2N1_9CAEN